MFKDRREYLSLGQILSVDHAEESSKIFCSVMIIPEEREIRAEMAWQFVGPGSGDYLLPAVEDLVIVAFLEGHPDYAYIIARLSNLDDPIPTNAILGDRVIKAHGEKKVWATSPNKIFLSKGDAEPKENLVLGQKFKTSIIAILEDMISAMETLATETHISSAPGYNTSVPNQASTYTSLKASLKAIKTSPYEDSAVLSDLSYTEK